MARPIDVARREELLTACVDYVIANGIADLSLRPLAAALDTQAPVLLHHFGSKEQLLVQILNGVRQRLRSVAREARGNDGQDGLNVVWRWTSDETHDALFRLFFEGYALALRQPDLYGGFLETVVRDWLNDLCPPMDEATATLTIAIVRGLLLDLLATGERERVDAAFVEAAQLLLTPASRSSRRIPR